MPRKATFAVKAPKKNSSAHNSREEIPKYLIDHTGNSGNTYRKIAPYDNDEQFKVLAKEIYNEKFIERTGQNQKMQNKQVDALIKEVVISVEPHHTEADIFALFRMLQNEKKRENEQDEDSNNGRNKEEVGYHILEIAGHRDEGHFVRKMYGGELPYSPQYDIMHKDDGKWYIKADELDERTDPEVFTELADMEEFRRIYNYHFHVKFTHFNVETGLAANFKKGEISGKGRLKKVADFLGLRYEPEEKIPIEQSVKSIKEQHFQVRRKMIIQLKMQHEQGLLTASHFQRMAEEHDQALAKKSKEQEEICEILNIKMPDGYDHSAMMNHIVELIEQAKSRQALMQKRQKDLEQLREQNMRISKDLQIKIERINELEKSIISYTNHLDSLNNENLRLGQEIVNEKEFHTQFELDLEKKDLMIHEISHELAKMKELQLDFQIDMGRMREAEKSSDSAWELAGEHLKRNKLLNNALDYLIEYAGSLSQDERKEISERILSGESMEKIEIAKEKFSIPTPPKNKPSGGLHL